MRLTMPRGLVPAAWVLAAACGVTGLFVSQRAKGPSAALSSDYGSVPEFALIGEDGGPLTRDMLRGRVWIVDFIFTRCAGQCPLMTQRMKESARAMAGEAGIGFLSVTVDPAYDTPAVLSAYRQAAALQDVRWRFATGEPGEVVRLIQQGLHLAVADGGPPQEPITHSVRLVLLDHAGRIRGYYDGTDAVAMHRLVGDAKLLVQSRS